MTPVYLCDEEKMHAICLRLETAHEYLRHANNMAKEVFERIDSQEDWVGEAQMVMAAFLDLLLQFHGDFINGYYPLSLCIAELKAHRKRGDEMCDTCNAILDIETIK